MDKEKMVLYLGYCALILIAIYFTYGILKVSGEGLASLGYENNFIREGFSDKDEKKVTKTLEKKNKENEGLQKFVDSMKDRINGVNDLPEYEELLENTKTVFDTVIRLWVQEALLAKDNGGREAQLKMAREWKQNLDLLNDYTI